MLFEIRPRIHPGDVQGAQEAEKHAIGEEAVDAMGLDGGKPAGQHMERPDTQQAVETTTPGRSIVAEPGARIDEHDGDRSDERGHDPVRRLRIVLDQEHEDVARVGRARAEREVRAESP